MASLAVLLFRQDLIVREMGLQLEHSSLEPFCKRCDLCDF